MDKNKWYQIKNIEDIDSPSLVLYEDCMEHNLVKMIQMVDQDTSRLMPHVKTNKMPKVIGRMLTLGIKNFKASTIAEAEIAALEGANTVLIAHQLVGPKIHRLTTLIKHFPNTNFSTIIDNLDSLHMLHEIAHKNNIPIGVYIDINSGMDRSGVELGKELTSILNAFPKLTSVKFLGFHVYDGHLRDSNFNDRKAKVEGEISSITKLFNTLKESNPDLQIICGGTPAFTAHLMEKNRICSPGTCVFWDWGYGDKLLEQDFKPAVLLITRVISKPTKGIVTIDLGHKAVASENPINQRVKFLNLEDYTLLSQSEEHGVLQVKNWDNIKVGDVFYGLPYHICPTINLYDEVSVIKNGHKTEAWEITGRKRKISI